MRNPKEDRRVRRTQKLLKESLVQLMSEKAFKDITIKDITERADLNRVPSISTTPIHTIF